MQDKLNHKGEQHLRCIMKKWVKKGTFDILNDISKNVILVQLTDYLVNVNYTISIVSYWIFDSNYEKSNHLTRELLDIICYPFIGE